MGKLQKVRGVIQINIWSFSDHLSGIWASFNKTLNKCLTLSMCLLIRTLRVISCPTEVYGYFAIYFRGVRISSLCLNVITCLIDKSGFWCYTFIQILTKFICDIEILLGNPHRLSHETPSVFSGLDQK